MSLVLLDFLCYKVRQVQQYVIKRWKKQDKRVCLSYELVVQSFILFINLYQCCFLIIWEFYYDYMKGEESLNMIYEWVDLVGGSKLYIVL